MTDSGTEVRYDPEAQPGVANLLAILAAATGGDPEVLAGKYTQYGPLKADAAAAVIELLRPLQERFAELAADPARPSASCAGEPTRPGSGPRPPWPGSASASACRRTSSRPADPLVVRAAGGLETRSSPEPLEPPAHLLLARQAPRGRSTSWPGCTRGVRRRVAP